jgi:hypothetical protein
MYNSVGGQYRTTIDNIFAYAEIYNAEYILLLTYDNSIEICNHLFTEGRDYLLQLPQKITLQVDLCIFDENLVYDLSK